MAQQLYLKENLIIASNKSMWFGGGGGYYTHGGPWITCSLLLFIVYSLQIYANVSREY